MQRADLSARNITVKPGPIETCATPAQGERAERVKAMVPFGRYGQPREIAERVAFLASTAASDVTGSQILIDGGMPA